jgi:hypothetical protein
MKAFELHTYQDGKWRIDSVFDDRELALYEAKRVDEGSRYPGVRVVEENYDDVSDLTTTRTIFRGGSVDHIPATKKKHTAAAVQGQERKTGYTPEIGKTRNPRQNQKKSNPFIPILILSFLVIAGLAALFGLQELSRLR